MLKDAPVPITSLTDEELYAAIDKQYHLLERLGPRLPDGGARLRIYLDKLKSESANRLKKPRTSVQLPPGFRKSATQRESGIQKVLAYETDTLEECNIKSETPGKPILNNTPTVSDLSEQLSSLAICCDVEVAENGGNSEDTEDFTTVPSLSLQEVARLRYLLNLPTLTLPTLQWFVFTIRLVESLVFLVAVDCVNPERYFFRLGLSSIWFRSTRSQFKTDDVSVSDDSVTRGKLTQPAAAVRDFWEFLTYQGSSANSGASVPCLICRTQSRGDDPNELVWFSRLLRSTRHYNVARASMPRDCRFLLLTPTSSVETHEKIHFSKGQIVHRERILQELWDIREEIFVDVRDEDSEGHGLQFRHHKSTQEFLKSGVTRSLPWMEAALELEFLRELKLNCVLAERLQHSVRLNDESPTTSDRGLRDVPNTTLRRLASVGLGRTRLSRLAGLAGWYGFAGFLAYRPRLDSESKSESANDKPGRNENSGIKALVTDDPQVLKDLYVFFRRVYSHLDRHNRYYRENRCQQTPHIQPPRSPFPVVDNPSRIRAWVSGGNNLFNPGAMPQSRVLSIEESVKLMQKAQKQYQEARMKRDLPIYPALPPESTKLYRYRDINREAMDGKQSSESEISSDTDESDADTRSDTSLHMEDVD